MSSSGSVNPLLALLAVGLLSTCRPPDEGGLEPPARPNVILIVADDMGWGDVGYHGGAARTAVLDRLAGEGVRLEQLYSMPACSPTRAALLTGRSPLRYGMTAVVRTWEDFGLPQDEVVLAELFRAAGYRTAMVGKWHLGHARREFLPAAQGFDTTYGMLGSWIDYSTHEHHGMLDWQRDGESVREPGLTTDLLVAEAVRLVQGAGERPLFLYLPFNAPHSPTQAPDPLWQEYAELDREDDRMPRGRSLHAAAVHHLDIAVGRLVQALEARGVADDTLLCFLSDNGAPDFKGDNGPFRSGKLSAYEGAVRVPCFLRWPNGLPAGRVERGMASVLDLFPTLAAAAGLDLPDVELDGEDLLPVLRGERELGERELFLYVERKDEAVGALRLGAWKLHELIREEGGSVEHRLFDLEADPGEQRDVADLHPALVRDLTARAAAWRALRPPGLTRSFGKPKGWSLPADILELMRRR